MPAILTILNDTHDAPTGQPSRQDQRGYMRIVAQMDSPIDIFSDKKKRDQHVVNEIEKEQRCLDGSECDKRHSLD